MHTFQHDGAAEEKQHAAAVLDLARSTGMAAEEVKRVYDLVLVRYRRHARFRDYLPILVSKRVRDLIASRRQRQRGLCGPERALTAEAPPERRTA